MVVLEIKFYSSILGEKGSGLWVFFPLCVCVVLFSLVLCKLVVVQADTELMILLP